jgi:hypothetical protein
MFHSFRLEFEFAGRHPPASHRAMNCGDPPGKVPLQEKLDFGGFR